MKKKVLIIAIVLVLVMLGTFGGYFGYKYWEGTQSTGTDWGDIYFSHIKEISDKLEEIENSDKDSAYTFGLPAGSKDVSATFINVDKQDSPELVLFYTCDNMKNFTLTRIKDNGEFDYRERNGEFELLYDIESGEYNYYYEITFDDGYHRFDSLKDIVQSTGGEDSNILFKEEQMETDFNDRFIKVKEEDYATFDITPNMDEGEIKKKVKEVVKKYKDFENNIKDEEKARVESKAEEIKEKNKVTKIDESKEIVYSAYKQNFTTGYGSTNTTDIPAFNINTDEIKKLNEEILSKFKTNEEDMTYSKTSYKYYENDNIISLIIDKTLTEMSYDEYDVYNVDKSTGKQLTKEEVLATKNITKEQYEATISTQIANLFSEMWDNQDSLTTAGDFLEEQRTKNNSKENCSMNKTEIYLGENGTLYYMANIYSLVAANSYMHTIKYETGERQDG